jgi:hypothetical protein
MSKTTIEIDERLRDQLREERKSHESSYADTIARLLGDSTGGQLWTEQEIKDITRRVVRDEVEGRMR